MGIEATAVGEFAECFDLHLLRNEGEGPLQLRHQDQVFTRVGARNSWHWAGFAQGGIPGQWRGGRCQQAAFLPLTSAVIITVEKWTILTSRCTHYLSGSASGASEVAARAGIHTDHIAGIDKTGHLYFQAGLGDHTLGYASSRIAAHSGLRFNDFQVNR